MTTRQRLSVLLILLLSCAVGVSLVLAQDAPPAAPIAEPATVPPTATIAPVVPVAPPTAITPLIVTLVEPSVLLAGRVGTLSIFGQGFSDATIARLIGFGLLRVTVVNAGAITAEVPAEVPPGTYVLEMSDPASPAVTAPTTITILAPTGTPAPTVAATETPLPTSTAPPPTPVPGQPALIVRRFAAQPASIAQGGTTQLQLELFNAGNRTADGIILALGADGAFTAAAGQAALVLPALAPSASTIATVTLTARRDAPLGSTTIPLSLRYRDSEGTTYSVPASASVLITAAAAQTARPVVDGYRVHDTPALIGETTNVTINLKNIGGVTAEAVVLRFTGDPLLLPTRAGDTFTFGTIAPDAFSVRTIPVRISSAAAPGLRVQAITVQYVENGAAREVQTSIGIEVAARTVDRPLILLEQYAVDVDTLTPGTRFTLTVTLHNIGAAPADALLATVGAVESSGSVSSAPPASGDSNAASTTGSTTTSTTPSTIFAPIDSGGTVFVGPLPAGERVTFSQRLLVNAGVTGGVQPLPITLRYQLADGSAAQTSLPASLVVLVPPRLQANLAAPLPPTVFVGEPLGVTLQLLNTGRNPQPIQQVELIADNADVLDGALSFVGVIAANDDVTVTGTLLPFTAGEVTFTFRVIYADELNQPQVLAYPFTVAVLDAPPIEPEIFPIEPVATPIPTDPPADFIGQLLIGFLNLAG